MALTVSALRSLTQGTDADAWRVIVAQAVEIASKPLAMGNAPSEVVKRDREIGGLDLFLSSCGWDLWQSFGDSVERTSGRLLRWWAEPFSAKAVLILDGLSLRELPWLLQGARERGLVVQPIAVKHDGTRIPAVERQCEKYLQAPAGTPAFQPEQRSDLFVHAVEPTLQRELKHKGAVNGDGSYSAELIGYVEIASRKSLTPERAARL